MKPRPASPSLAPPCIGPPRPRPAPAGPKNFTKPVSRQNTIKFKPRVRLQWGANIDGDNIVEKQDVYLESWIQWYRVEPSKKPGADMFVLSGHSLVIQGVTPGHSGAYSCGCVTSNTACWSSGSSSGPGARPRR